MSKRSKQNHKKVDWSEFAIPKRPPKRLHGKAYSKLRKEVYETAGGICSRCGAYAPLTDENGQFDVFSCGHVAHRKSRGSGGDDTIENTDWLCPTCHLEGDHGPRWSGRGEL